MSLQTVRSGGYSDLLKRISRFLILTGAVFAVFLPVVFVHEGLVKNAQEQGERLVNSIALTMVERADLNVTRAFSLLSELALLGVSTCNVDDIREMRRALHNQFWVKEVGIIGATGDFLCNQFGDASILSERSRGLRSDTENITFQVVRRKGGVGFETLLTWELESGFSIGAILPGEALADDVIPEKMRNKGVALTSLNDGTILFMAPDQMIARALLPFDERTFTSSLKSTRFPFYVTVLAPYDVIWNDFAALYQKAIASAVVVGVILLSLTFFAMRPKKARTNEIEAAMEAGEFIPYYQPTIDIQSGELVGCEVLIRWRKADGSILSPGSFIGLAEATGLAIQMTRNLMIYVADEMEDLHEGRPGLKLGINLFDDHFENLDIITDIKEIFGPSKISYSQLMFEVTERQPLNDIERARVVIRNMRSLGAKVALDDAGTGHGGLAYLQQLGLDVIKIDKLFIDAIGTESLSTPIVDSLISLADSLGMDIIAEGVEETLQVEYLREKGIRMAQGYLFAKPLPGETYKKLIEKMVPLSKRPDERRRARARPQNRAIASAA